MAPNGDRAIVNVQSSQFNTRDAVRFIVNLAIVPEPWWAWQVGSLGAANTKTPRESHGLWRDRLHPSPAVSDGGSEPWWLVRDVPSAQRCGRDVVHQLTRAGVPTLRALLDRDRLTAAVRAGDLGLLKGPRPDALAVLLTDQGPSPELDRLLALLESEPNDRRRAHYDRLVAWIGERVVPRS
jgi:hypothetical protein